MSETPEPSELEKLREEIREQIRVQIGEFGEGSIREVLHAAEQPLKDSSQSDDTASPASEHWDRLERLAIDEFDRFSRDLIITSAMRLLILFFLYGAIAITLHSSAFIMSPVPALLVVVLFLEAEALSRQRRKAFAVIEELLKYRRAF